MQSRGEAILRAIIDGGSASDLPAPQSRVEALLLELLESGAAGSLAIHVCTVDEYDAETGVPTVQDPDEKTIYLVPGDNETGSDLYIEWIYVDSNWEQFGSATIDLSDYALKSDLTGVVYNNSYASTSTGGVVKYNTSKGISVDNAGILTIYPAESGTIKSGSDAYKPIVPATQHEAAFYGLAEAAGDLTQISSQNAVGVYTDNAKSAIRQMIGSVGQDMIAADYASLSFPVSKGDHCIHGGKLYEAAQDIATTEAWTAAHWTEIVLGYEVADLKSALDNAGITSKTYTPLFGGEFTVTTVSASGYTNPVATYSVTSPSFDSRTRYRVSVNGTEYDLLGRIWKKVVYSQSNYSSYTYIGKHAVCEPDIPILDDPDVPFCIKCLTNSLEVSTNVAGTYTILVEEVSENYKKLPNELVYGTPYAVFEKDDHSNVPNYSFLGANCMKSYGGTIIGDCNTATAEYADIFGDNNLVSARCGTIMGTYNQISGQYGAAIGTANSVSGEGGFACCAYNTVTGARAFSTGSNTTASGMYSFSEGNQTNASGTASHAEGNKTTASGNMSHAEGNKTTASGLNSHAEGGSTTASGLNSHAEGVSTIANHESQHVHGGYNVADPSNNGNTNRGNYIEIVGNGTADNARSNAYALDWDGNGHFAGDVYVGCNSDSTGGTKLACIPYPPNADGTYTLQATVSDGAITYTWVSST